MQIVSSIGAEQLTQHTVCRHCTSVQDPVAHSVDNLQISPASYKGHIPMFTANKMFTKSQVKKDFSSTKFRNMNMKLE